MAEVAKYHLISPNGGLLPDLKTQFSVFMTRGRKSKIFAYGFLILFVGYTLFLAFSPPPSAADSSSPWFLSVFYSGGTSSSSSTSTSNHTSSSSSSYSPSGPEFAGSQSTPNLTTPRTSNLPPTSPNDAALPPPQFINPQPAATEAPNPKDVSGPNSSAPTDSAPESGSSVDGDAGSSDGLPVSEVTAAGNSSSGPGFSAVDEEKKSVKEKALMSNYTASLSMKQGAPDSPPPNPPPPTSLPSSSVPSWVESLLSCDLYDGRWVRDDSYPLYDPGSCGLIDEQVNCFDNGRPDHDYPKYKWKPKACTLPRLNPRYLIKLLMGKHLVFVGDSLNRNMWESLICILRTAVKDQSNVFEASGRVHFRSEAFYSFVFKDYNFTIDFYAAPFIVRQWEATDSHNRTTKRETLRLDLMGESADQFKNADFLVFNTGHWWTHDKTSKGEDYYQEGNHVYHELNVTEAFRRAMTTWARWIDTNIDPSKTQVFFRGYSNSHFSGGQWNSGGACDNETEPITNDAYLTEYPWKGTVLESILQGMKTPVSYLNVTKLTDYRKDGHPSIYRKKMITEEERRSPLKYQDCSHWCLPGVPDAWNELLYAELLIKQYKDERRRRNIN